MTPRGSKLSLSTPTRLPGSEHSGNKLKNQLSPKKGSAQLRTEAHNSTRLLQKQWPFFKKENKHTLIL